MWCLMTPDEILTEYVVDNQRIEADCRDASERIQASIFSSIRRQEILLFSIT